MPSAQQLPDAVLAPTPVLAAGGIVWGPKPGSSRVAVIHRSRHGGDWTLPKGKWNQGETLAQTAVREVKEEIGATAHLGPFAGTVTYLIEGDVPKVVLFWSMKVGSEARFVPSEEVDRLEWLRPREALKRLSYGAERELLSQVAGLAPGNARAGGNEPKGVRPRRLGAELAAYRPELERRIASVDADSESRWTLAAGVLLRRSEAALAGGNLQEGWECLLAAQRMEIFGMGSGELLAREKTLRQEAGKLRNWRQGALRDILDLLPQQGDDQKRVLLFRATRVRDEDFVNQYFKQELAWQQLKILSVCLLIITATAVALLTGTRALAPEANLPGRFLLLGVALFGALGAGFSTALSLLELPAQTRIPERVAQSSVTLTRPLLGAVAALATYLFLQSGLIQLPSPNLFIVLLASFAAGFSDRLVLRAVEAVQRAGL